MFLYPYYKLNMFGYELGLYFVSYFMWKLSTYFEDGKVLEYTVSWLLSELNKLQPVYDSEIFTTQKLTYKGLPMMNDTSYLLHRTDADGVGSEISVFNMWLWLSKFGRFGFRLYEIH